MEKNFSKINRQVSLGSFAMLLASSLIEYSDRFFTLNTKTILSQWKT